MTDEPSQPERGRLTPAHTSELVEHLATGAATKLPLDEVFAALAEETDQPALRRAALGIAAELRRGADVRTAVTSAGRDLPPFLKNALVASSDPSETAALLTGVAQHETTRKRLRRQLSGVLLYPAVVLSLLAAVLIGLTVLVVPQFETIFYDFDLQLPQLTSAIINVSKYLPVALGVLVALVPVYYLICLWPGGRRIMHWLRTSVPVLGRLWIWNGQHEFSSILGALTSQRVPMDQALACTSASLRDANLARATRIVAVKCAKGTSLANSMAESIHFDPALPGLVSWGEAHGALPKALSQAAKTFEEELDLQASFLARIMPPVLFIMVATTLFLFVFAMFVPLIDLINHLSG